MALHRCGRTEENVTKAQEYLKNLVRAGRSVTLSSFAKAVLLYTLPKGAKLKSLKLSASDFISSFGDQSTETISFFDYLEPGQNDQTTVKRDYLCYPSLLTFSLMVAGLSKHGSLFSVLKNASVREALAVELSTALSNDTFFRLPGAKYAATVDQAAIALAYEHLSVSRARFDRLGNLFVELTNKLKRSWFVSTVAPAALVVLAFWILNTPDFALKLASASWVSGLNLDNWVLANETKMRLIASIVPFVCAYLPGYVYQRVRNRLSS